VPNPNVLAGSLFFLSTKSLGESWDSTPRGWWPKAAPWMREGLQPAAVLPF